MVFLGFFVQHDQGLGDIETLLLDELVKIKIVELLRQVTEMEGGETVLFGVGLVSLLRARPLLLRHGGTHDGLQAIHNARIHDLVRRARMGHGLLLLSSDRHRVRLLLLGSLSGLRLGGRGGLLGWLGKGHRNGGAFLLAVRLAHGLYWYVVLIEVGEFRRCF